MKSSGMLKAVLILYLVTMMSSSLCTGHKIAWALVVIGALNWGLVGFFDWNLVNALLGSMPTLERVVYAIVGLSAIFSLFCGQCTMCKTGKKM